MGRIRTAIMLLIGAAVGAAFLWFALRAIDFRAVLAIALRAEKRDVVGIVICALAFTWVKAARWSRLMGHLRALPADRLIGPVIAGSACNFAVPHVGELVRVWIVSRREHLPKAALLASIAVERLFDFCAALLLGLVALLAGRAVFDTIGTPLWVLLAFTVTILGAALPFAVWPKSALGVSRSVLGLFPASVGAWVLRHLEHGIKGLDSLQRGPILAKVLALSVVQWTFMAACVWLSLHAVGVAPDFAQAVVILLLLIVGLTLPAAPGHVGTTQVAFLLSAAPFGVGREEALAGSLVYNVFLPVPLIMIGIGVLLKVWNRPIPPDGRSPSQDRPPL
jgi:glycosyltransferase 2 family protein